MGPLHPTSNASLPESFSRRRWRAGSAETVVGDLPAIPSFMAMDEKDHPVSPKFVQTPKSPDSNFQYDRMWRSVSQVSDDHANETNAQAHAQALDHQNSLTKQSLFRDLCQTQLSLWTFVASTLLTYFWQKRVHLRSLIFACCAIGCTVFMSWILAAVVVAAHLFNSDFAGSFGGFGDWLSDDEIMLKRQSSGYRRGSGSKSGTTSPRQAGEKQQIPRFWQKNVSLERMYIGTSRS